MSGQRQRQRHGVHKHLAEGIGGVIVGAALVLLLRNRMHKRSQTATPAAMPQAAPADQEAEA